ncbi:ABC transporter ATP-binding protein [Pseudaminobacter sp. NGMCC 1.201702]|uniref:ABC transporter ATP-binding protein n=1 Tax=Pseudaminobacter sp. NGMCC 1.201702 TaxID=3391825 RepID=UPI0039F0E074
MAARDSNLALKWPVDEGDAQAQPTNPFVSISDVNLTYGGPGGVLAVEKLTMTVREGEFAAVVGPSGCGKSTLMKLTTGLVIPQVGQIAVKDKPVTGPLNIVGMAFQNPSLLPWRTTLDNVMLPLEIVSPHRERLKKNRDEYRAKAEAMLELVGLKGFGQKFPWQLSGGMQQRANLCRALIHEPGLLMLDEPFGALDAFTREELWGVIRDLHQAKRFTVILVTHDLREAVYLADRVFVMSARPGRVLLEREVGFPRPRPIEVTYSSEFNDVVHELREKIAEARADTPQIGAKN